jgi:uncharacterized GH25 family protein
MKTKFAFTLLILASIVSLTAHEFWLAPQQFFFKKTEIANIRFNVGEGFKGDNWKGNNTKAVILEHIAPDEKVIDIRHQLGNAVGDSLTLSLKTEGTQMIVFNSTNSFITLDAKKFDEYLTEDGLGYIRAARKKYGEENKPSNEYYQRSVKTIIQVGEKLSTVCTKPTSLPLDIIPQVNPYQKNNTPTISFTILFKKKPLKNSLLKYWVKPHNGKVMMEDVKTNNEGVVIVPKKMGIIMLSGVYMERVEKDPKAQWQSYWGSCTFEIR